MERLLLLLTAGSALLPGARGDCPSPPPLNNTVLKDVTNRTFPIGSTVTYICDAEKGYVKLPDKNDTITCLADSSWSAIVTFCERSCPMPARLNYSQLEDQFLQMTVFPVGTNLTYTCRPGYIRIPGKLRTITCQETLTWSVIPEFCEPRDCGNPGELLNGKVSLPNIEGTDLPDTKFGSVATFSCNEGYKLLGRATRQCGATGIWSNTVPQCDAVICQKPPELANGTHSELDKEEFVYLSVVQYSCNPDFSLIGNESIFCTKDGEWSGPAPKCTVVRCENPSVENGVKDSGFGSGTYKYKESVSFKCKEGFVMIGSNRVECNENSEWYPNLPTCVRPPSPTTKPTIQVGTSSPDKDAAATMKTTKEDSRENDGFTGGSKASHITKNTALILTMLLIKWSMHLCSR